LKIIKPLRSLRLCGENSLARLVKQSACKEPIPSDEF
jgi:hypothetical protein